MKIFKSAGRELPFHHKNSNLPDHVELENLRARRLVAGEVASIVLGRDGRLALLPATKGGGGCPSSF